jgi:hypothetical protein
MCVKFYKFLQCLHARRSLFLLPASHTVSDKEKQVARVKPQRFSGGQYLQRGVLGILDINGRVVKGHYIAKLLQYSNVTH